MLYLLCVYHNVYSGKELTAMPESHVKFHSMNGKRRVLIVDDEMINREMLGNILSDKYETVYACSGTEAVKDRKSVV